MTKDQTLNKLMIANHLKEKLGISGLICEEIVDEIFNQIIKITLESDQLQLKNFGTFNLKNKASRPGMNLQNNSKIQIAPRKVLTFNAAKKLKQFVNRSV